MIRDWYTTSFTASRMVWKTDVDGNEFAELEATPSFKGHIQQSSMDLAQSLGLAYTKTFTIWCSATTDVSESDQLVSGGFTYTVRAKQEFGIGPNAHFELVCERKPYTV